MEPTDSSPLCCCEYYNLHGQRTHLIALCCDCEDLDNAVDQCLKGQGISTEKFGIICKVVTDRIRLPWFRGAVKFDTEAIVPIIILTSSLYFASSGFVFTVLAFVYLPLFVLVFYTCTLRNKRKTWFFVSWACTSMAGIYALFMIYIADKCSSINNIALSLAFILILMLYYRVVTSKDKISLFTQLHDQPLKSGVVPEMKNPRSKGTDIDYEQLSCCFCTYGPFSRSKHCRICGYCVPRSDHHCVWTNCCIGHHNQLLFLVTIIAFVISGSWGVYLSLNTICNPVPYSKLILDCSAVYNKSGNAIMFVSSFYSIIFIFSMLALFLQQVFFISFNITGDEWRRGSRHKSLWQILSTNPHNRGFLLNWMDFLFPRLLLQTSYELV